MAEMVPIDATHKAKVRHPVAVPVLTLVTLGIYGIYWWYAVNREMADLGRARNADGLGDSPGKSLAAVFPGFLLIVPPIMSLYNGNGRMQRTQELVLGRRSLNGWITLGLILGGFVIPFLGLVAYGYMQSELNKVWENLEQGDGALGAGDLMTESQYRETTAAPADPPTEQR